MYMTCRILICTWVQKKMRNTYLTRTSMVVFGNVSKIYINVTIEHSFYIMANAFTDMQWYVICRNPGKMVHNIFCFKQRSVHLLMRKHYWVYEKTTCSITSGCVFQSCGKLFRHKNTYIRSTRRIHVCIYVIFTYLCHKKRTKFR